MPRDNATRCDRILDRASMPLLERARKLQRLEQATLKLLPPDLAAHCRVLNLKSEILVLAASSSAWASRLRFAVPELIRQFERRHALKLHTIEVRVQETAPEKHPVEHQKQELSLASGELLAQTARSISDPGLREALYRLAARAREI